MITITQHAFRKPLASGRRKTSEKQAIANQIQRTNAMKMRIDHTTSRNG